MTPQILLTNDDGIESRGLWTAAAALTPLGEVTVVAPSEQWSGAGRSFPKTASGKIDVREKFYGGEKHRVYAVDGSPAQAVLFAVFEILPAPPDLVVAGINFGENVGFGITISGTVGAVLEAAACGLRALAVSQETPSGQTEDVDFEVDFSTAGHFTFEFARKLIALPPQADVSAWKVDVPLGASPETPWILTRLSRTRYYQPVRPARKSFSEAVQIPFHIRYDSQKEDPGSDVHALHIGRKVSLTPLSLDLTARADFPALDSALRGSE
ncbi:MAG: 5'/3'-nucleotidase SurE [Chloroflexi bacterium RBG_13_60_9]|nr:MAG: 5'/3'-nucleotidase SurE [Chloroflexi bacterium RBG_13_60_9]